MKLLKNLNEFSQSFAQIIFAPDEEKQKTKKTDFIKHNFISVPDDLVPYLSYFA